MRASCGRMAAFCCSLAVASGCAPSAPESQVTPAIVSAATTLPLEGHVEPPPPSPVVPPLALGVDAASSVKSMDAQSPATTAEQAVAGAAQAAVEPTAPYEPPFPNRTDLFVAPKRAGGAAAGPASGDNAVLLMGFVRVDQAKAVLSINGEIAPMAAGESRYGVDVISIAPPNVVLQRGRQRWQTTLE